MRILGRIHKGPDFGGTELRFFGNRHIPMRVVEQHEHGIAAVVHLLVDSKNAMPGGVSLGNSRDGAKFRGKRAFVRDRWTRYPTRICISSNESAAKDDRLARTNF